MIRHLSVCLLLGSVCWSPTAQALSTENQMEIGVSFGLPAGLNFGMGLWAGRLGVRGFGGYLGPLAYGGQLGVGFDFAGERTSNAAMLIVGHSSLTLGDWTYAGLAYDLRTQRGFFLELGITGGVGSFATPQFHFQIGYLYPMDLG